MHAGYDRSPASREPMTISAVPRLLRPGRKMRAHAAAGISHVQIWLTPDTIASVEAFAPVLELLDRG